MATRTKRARTGRRLSQAERERNTARLAEVNAWLGTVDLALWHVGDPISIDGYLLGVMMTYLPKPFTIMASSIEQVRAVEAR
jgi:hypothetical protein